MSMSLAEIQSSLETLKNVVKKIDSKVEKIDCRVKSIEAIINNGDGIKPWLRTNYMTSKFQSFSNNSTLDRVSTGSTIIKSIRVKPLVEVHNTTCNEDGGIAEPDENNGEFLSKFLIRLSF